MRFGNTRVRGGDALGTAGKMPRYENRMPIRSMTGFAQVKGQVSDPQISVPEKSPLGFALSLKSVNHRFLDVHFRMPSDSDALEMKLRRLLQVEGQFHVPPGHFLLEQPAQLHLQRIAVGRHAEVHIEKAVVYRLQRQSEAHGLLPGTLICGDQPPGPLPAQIRSWNE